LLTKIIVTNKGNYRAVARIWFTQRNDVSNRQGNFFKNHVTIF